MTDFTLRLDDGRTLSYAVYGDPDGRPVFAFHGWPGSRLDAEFLAQTAVEMGIRVIAPDRPGYGGSTFQPARSLSDWPADVVALADSLALDRFGVIGICGGGPYAFACAKALPNRLTAAGIVCGLGPLDLPGCTVGMNRNNRLLFTLARRAPSEGEEEAVVPIHAHGAAGQIQRPEATDDAGRREAVRQRLGARERVGSASADADDAEPIQREGVGQRHDVGRPVAQRARRLESGAAVTGAVRCNDSNPHLDGCLGQELGVEARARPAVKREHRPAVGVAVHGVGKRAAVVETQSEVRHCFPRDNRSSRSRRLNGTPGKPGSRGPGERRAEGACSSNRDESRALTSTRAANIAAKDDGSVTGS